MRASVLFKLTLLTFFVPYAIMLVPLYFSYWVLRPYTGRTPTTGTGPRLPMRQ
jgi:hypothetical protein